MEQYNNYTNKMLKRKLSINQMKGLAIIFGVVLIGVGLFDLAFSYLYKDALEMGSCSLCFELNPGYASCENWTAVNFSNITYVSYGK